LNNSFFFFEDDEFQFGPENGISASLLTDFNLIFFLRFSKAQMTLAKEMQK